jgi:RsmE family RNA methyltransferase
VNLLLLDSDDFVDESRAVLHDHRYQHVTRVQRAKIGDRLRVGKLDGLTGSATVEAIGDRELRLRVKLDTPPPPKLPLTLVLALPRPKMLRRILRSVCELGIEHLLIINSYRVEKSFWQSPALQPEAIRTALVDGLQQARDTRPPRVDLKPLFKPFVEDELAAITDTRQQALVAHPGGAVVAPGTQLPTVLAIGPEGGFIDFEIDLLQGAGFATLDLGPRILRVENAVTFGVARLFG